MERFKEQMEKEALLLSESPGSALLTKEKFDRIVQHLKQQDNSNDAHFRHWVKKSKFSLTLMNKLGIGLIDVLVVPNKKVKDEGSASVLRVLHADNIVSVLYEIHAIELKHSGYKKVLEYSQRHYQGPTRHFVQKFCSMCPTCKLSAPQISRPPSRPPLKPMIPKDFLECVQINLIDMRHNPDGEYHYIAHFMDHFSKFHVLFPLKTKSAPEVAQLLEERVLAYFGQPKMFHSDNGREFVNQITKALFQSWGGQVTFVNGMPRHSQSQGLVERGNRTVEQKLAAMKVNEGLDSNDIYPWASWLPRIMFSLNTEVQRTTNEPPYTVVFGKSPPSGLFSGASRLIEEEDLPEEEQEESQEQRPVPGPRTALAQQHHLDSDTESPPTDLYRDDDALSEEGQNRDTFVRKRTYRKTVEAVERMEHFYNKKKRIKIATFSVGDVVSVGIPKLDRASTDLRRLPAVITQIDGVKRRSYSLATKHGRLKTKHLEGDLEKFCGEVTPDLTQDITLREAAKRHHPL